MGRDQLASSFFYLAAPATNLDAPRARIRSCRVAHGRRHKVPTRGTKRFPSDLIFGGLRVLALDYRRGPYNQTSRKAGCGKSARPV
jgi:hypothetical protein